MGGLVRFLLGVALGIALGFLISRKRFQKIQKKGAQPLSLECEAPAATPWAESGAPWAPTAEAEAAVEAPFVAAEAPDIAEPVAEEAPVAPESDSEPPSVVTPELLEEPLLVTEDTLPHVPLEAESPAGPLAADDLRARVEETRRRIRMELEQPFVAPGSGVAAQDGAVGEEVPMEPTPEPVIGEALMEPASELGVDYDAMRGRIETTRDRLKAKAFDAMMTGESALLGRDPAKAAGGLPAVTDVDSEIVEAIETTLREEEG